MENEYMHEKCHSVLSKINQIVGDQIADRKEEGTTYVPVYVDITGGTIKVGTHVAGSVKHEHHYLQRFLSTPTPECHKILPLLQSESNNYKDLSCRQTLPALFKRTQCDEDSVLNMLLELEPIKSDGLNRTRSLSPDICIDITDDSSRKGESEYTTGQPCVDSTLCPTQNRAHTTNSRKEESEYTTGQPCVDSTLCPTQDRAPRTTNIPHDRSYNQLNSVSKSYTTSETTSVDIHVGQPQHTLLHVKSITGESSRMCSQRYRLKKRLETQQIIKDVRKLMEVGSKLQSDLFKLINNIKHMKLLVLATGKFKTEIRQLQNSSHLFHSDNTPNQAQSNQHLAATSFVADYHQQDYTSRINNFISQLERNMQQECGHKKALKQEIIENYEEVLKTNIKIKADLSKLIGTVKQMKLLLLTSGEFKSAYLKKLQKHLLLCRCRASETIDVDLMLSYELVAGISYRSNNSYNQVDLIPEPSTSSTYLNADTPQGYSSITIFEHNYQKQNYAQEKLQIKKIMDDTGKVLKQMKKIQSDLSCLTVSVKNVILMSGKFLTKSSSGLKNYNL